MTNQAATRILLGMTILGIALLLPYAIQLKIATKLDNIGSFQADSQGTSMVSTLRVPRGYDRSSIGISIDDSHDYFAAPMAITTNLANLRIRIELFSGAKSNEFYSTEFALRGKMSYYNFWAPDYGILVGGGERFPAPVPGTNGDSFAFYREGANTNPMSRGALNAAGVYKLKLTIIKPCPITNRFSLWLYSSKEWRVGTLDWGRVW